MNTQALNPAALDRLNAVAPRLLAELAEMYLSDTPIVLAGLRKAVATNDLPTLRMLKHRLKGSSGVFGAKQLMALCDSFDVGTDLPSWLYAVETEYTRVVEALEQEAGLVTI